MSNIRRTSARLISLKRVRSPSPPPVPSVNVTRRKRLLSVSSESSESSSSSENSGYTSSDSSTSYLPVPLKYSSSVSKQSSKPEKPMIVPTEILPNFRGAQGKLTPAQCTRLVKGNIGYTERSKLACIFYEDLEMCGVTVGLSNGIRGGCLREAISRGFLENLDIDTDRYRVIVQGTLSCGHVCGATLNDLILQRNHTDQSTNWSTDPPVFCHAETEDGMCGNTAFVKGLCTGNPVFEENFHEDFRSYHCDQCRVCVDNKLLAHCNGCGKHFWNWVKGDKCYSCHTASYYSTSGN